MLSGRVADEDAVEKLVKDVAAAEGADNLKKLTGIGPALEKKLNSAGITTYAQIAALTDAQIADLEEQLSLAGRFAKDGWVEQAKELAKGA